MLRPSGDPPLTTDRASTLTAAANALAALPPTRAFVGFDGFIDLILRPVASRASMAADDYTPVRTMSEFADRIKAAAGKSTNIETVLHEARFGGNGPLMAGALGSLGFSVTYAGAVGTGGVNSSLHPVFVPFAERCSRVVTLAEPSTTACYEFADGKLMLNDRTNVQKVTRGSLIEAFGAEGLRRAVGDADLIGLVNWSLMGGVADLLTFFGQELLPSLPAPTKPRTLFIDLADPTPRSRDELRACLSSLVAMDRVPGCRVTLGLNLMESEIVAAALGADGAFKNTTSRPADAVRRAAVDIRAALGLTSVVIHPREGAAAATESESCWFDGPFCESPKLSTGAGDHFNAGYATAAAAGLPIAQCLAAGTATSGFYVREAKSPTRAELASFLRSLALA
jgi:sugar/nucleoside kinase (ribokinase family)